MDNDPLRPPSSPVSTDLGAAYDSLHSLLVGVLLVSIVVSGTLCVFLLRQATYAKLDLNMVSAGYTNAAAQYERTKSIIDETVKKLQDFGRTNSDFVPILAKYNLLPGTNSAPPQTGRTPAKK